MKKREWFIFMLIMFLMVFSLKNASAKIELDGCQKGDDYLSFIKVAGTEFLSVSCFEENAMKIYRRDFSSHLYTLVLSTHSSMLDYVLLSSPNKIPVQYQGQSSELHFYLDTQSVSQKCQADELEIQKIHLYVDLQKNEIKKSTPEETGVCIKKSDVEDFLVNPYIALQVLDFNIDPSSWAVKSLALYFSDFLQENNKIMVVSELQTKKPQAFELTDKDAFPTGCGTYFMSARLLGDSNQLALFYKDTRVKLWDFSKKNLKQTYFGGLDGGVATCEGYSPSFSSLRGDFFELEQQEVLPHLDPLKKVIYYKHFSAKKNAWLMKEFTW